MKKLVMFLVLPTFLVTGCSSEKVIVVDSKGVPVQDAEIYAVSLSMSTGPAKTNAKGEATVPSNRQGARWIAVKKMGYQEMQVSIPAKWPLTVTVKAK